MTTGIGLCDEHRRCSTLGFIALIECDPERSGQPSEAGRLKLEQAHRTGRLAHLKREVFADVFDVPIAAEQAAVFNEPGVIERLQAMTTPTTG